MLLLAKGVFLPLMLDKFFDTDGIGKSGEQADLGNRIALPAAELPSKKIVETAGVFFLFPDSESNNFLTAQGQTINVEPAYYSLVAFLGLSIQGYAITKVRFCFSDGSTLNENLSVPPWNSAPLFGEEISFETSHYLSNSEEKEGTARIFTVKIPLPPEKILNKIILPVDKRIKIAAITLLKTPPEGFPIFSKVYITDSLTPQGYRIAEIEVVNVGKDIAQNILLKSGKWTKTIEELPPGKRLREILFIENNTILLQWQEGKRIRKFNPGPVRGVAGVYIEPYDPIEFLFYDASGKPWQEKVLLMSLQGIVNHGSKALVLFEKDLSFFKKYAPEIRGKVFAGEIKDLLLKFASEITGYVVYHDKSQIAQALDLAIVLGGRALLATPDLAKELEELGFRKLGEAQNKPEWLELFNKQTDKKAICMLESNYYGLDFIYQNKIFCINIKKIDMPQLNQIFTEQPDLTPVYLIGIKNSSGIVKIASKHNLFTLNVPVFYNLSLWSAIKPPKPADSTTVHKGRLCLIKEYKFGESPCQIFSYLFAPEDLLFFGRFIEAWRNFENTKWILKNGMGNADLEIFPQKNIFLALSKEFAKKYGVKYIIVERTPTQIEDDILYIGEWNYKTDISGKLVGIYKITRRDSTHNIASLVESEPNNYFIILLTKDCPDSKVEEIVEMLGAHPGRCSFGDFIHAVSSEK